MNHWSRRSFLSAAGLVTPWAAALAAPKIPRQAPSFVITLNSGQRVSLDQHLGKVIALELLLTTCPHCQRCATTMQKIHEEFAGQGLVVLGAAVNDGARNLLTGFQISTGARFPIGTADRELTYQFLQADLSPGASPVYFPQLVFIDRKGVIRAQYGGTDKFFLDEEKSVREQVNALLRDGSSRSAARPSTGGAK